MAKIKTSRHGFVEISIDPERKFLDIPKSERIYLKFDYNAIADADRELKPSSTLLLFMNPRAIGTDDVRILLGCGLKHQFPTITTAQAGELMQFEKFPKVLVKVMEALSYAMEGWFDGDASEDIKDMRVRAVSINTEEVDEAEEGEETVKVKN